MMVTFNEFCEFRNRKPIFNRCSIEASAVENISECTVRNYLTHYTYSMTTIQLRNGAKIIVAECFDYVNKVVNEGKRYGRW